MNLTNCIGPSRLVIAGDSGNSTCQRPFKLVILKKGAKRVLWVVPSSRNSCSNFCIELFLVENKSTLTLDNITWIWARWSYHVEKSFWCKGGFVAYLTIGGLWEYLSVTNSMTWIDTNRLWMTTPCMVLVGFKWLCVRSAKLFIQNLQILHSFVHLWLH